MSLIPYNTESIGRVKQLLINQAEAGKPQDYEIRVDELRVVPRTNDPDQFDTYEEFVSDTTKRIVVFLYDGTSRRNTRHTFLLKEEKPEPTKQNPLNGTENLIKQERKQWQYELLEKENKDLKKKNEEAEEFIEKLTGEIEKLKSGRKLEEVNWGNLLGIAGESLLRRNTHLIAKVPGMQGLAGIIEEDSKKNETQQIETPKPEMEASFKMKEEKESQEQKPEPSEEDKDRIGFLKQLQERLTEEELKNVLALLNILVEKTKAVEPTLIFAIQWKEKVKEKCDEDKDVTPQPENQPEKKEELNPEIKTEAEVKDEPKENSVTEESSEDELKEHTF